MWQLSVGFNTAAHLCLHYVHHFELRLWRSSGGLIVTAHQGCNEVRWRPGQETSYAALISEPEVYRKQM